jgi:hypothetical protein
MVMNYRSAIKASLCKGGVAQPKLNSGAHPTIHEEREPEFERFRH